MVVYLGVNWSDDGWLAVAFDRTGFDRAAVFAEVGELWHRYEEQTERVLVDVPIGLKEGSGDRACDKLAREVLGPRGEAVVGPPVREATRKRRYPAARRTTRRIADGELTQRAFDVSEPVAAVDDLLRNVPAARAVFAEAHPEVCLRAFADDPLQYPTQTAGGYAERMRALAAFDTDAPPTVQRVAESVGGTGLPVEDVLDAVALAYTARPGPGRLRSLPPDPPRDPKGLPMGTHYRAVDPLETAV
jgi:predicted RNase H-like nuclease